MRICSRQTLLGLTILLQRFSPAVALGMAILNGCGRERPFADGSRMVEGQVPASSADASTNSVSPTGDQSVGANANDNEALQPISGGSSGGSSTGVNQEGANCAGDGGACPPTFDAGGGETPCSGCLIASSCIAVGAVNIENPCQVCDPVRGPRDWSANDGASCNDGIACTINDACSAGACVGATRQCDDGVACNGVSTCDEASGECAPGVNQCGANMACDVGVGACVSTCNGCLINGICLADGAVIAGNPCLVCNVALSATAPSPAVGKSCGNGPTACSGQDTCDAAGVCQVNHLAQNTSCGNPASSACNQADTCDGNGNCLQGISTNGSACNDGAFCTVGDSCQGGECLPTGARNCGAGSICDETADQCRCQGCTIAGGCFAAGTLNPGNSCQVCDPARSASAFSANTNAVCGDGQTCNAAGACVVVVRQALGTRCTVASDCTSGFCRSWFQDLDGDAHGDPNQSTLLCSPSPADDELFSQASGRLLPIIDDVDGRSYAGVGDDCCDTLSAGGNSIFPGLTAPLTIPQTACSNVLPFDYDCSGQEEDQFFVNTRTGSCGANCQGGFWVQEPPCGEFGDAMQCTIIDGSCTTTEPSSQLRVCI